MHKIFAVVLFTSFFFLVPLTSPASSPSYQHLSRSNADFHVPILLYHRFGDQASNTMTVTTTTFESQLDYLRTNGYRIIPLRRLVDWYLRKGPPPPEKSVIVAIDDGHNSICTHLLPIIRRYNVPITLFIYPSAISNADYALTWAQLKTLKKTGLIDIQSHSYWHPNFRKERKKLTRDEYLKFVDIQLKKSKEKLEKELGGPIDMLAWPFGELPDADLVQMADKAGYIAAFTIIRRQASPADSRLMLPRFIILDSDKGKAFERILNPSASIQSPSVPKGKTVTNTRLSNNRR